MTDVEAKTPTKRKNFTGAQDKKGSAKKAKLNNVKTPQKAVSPKQKFAKKNKKNSESEKDSPKKLKPFPGTQATGAKKGKEAKKNDGTENNEKKKRRSLYQSLGLQVKSDNKEEAIKSIEEKLQTIQSRGELSKTARRKVKLLQKLKQIAEGKPVAQPQQKAPHSKSESTKRRERKKKSKNISTETSIGKNESEKVVQQSNDVKTNGKSNKNQKIQNKKVIQKTIPQKQVKQDENDSDEDSDDEIGLEEDESGSENAVDAEQESGEEEEDAGESDEEEEDAEEESDQDEEEDESDEEEDTPPPPKIKRSSGNVSSNKKQEMDSSKKASGNNNVNLEELKENNLVVKNQKRFVLFVGNIPYDTNKLDLTEHFKKSGEIKHIRIPTEKKTSKPRGFAYVELANEETYQKCLSMHHTFLKGRRINVLYTQGGKKKGEDKKKEIKAKNFKLHAMRKQGKLAGSKKQNQKRSFRRAKMKSVKNENETQD